VRVVDDRRGTQYVARLTEFFAGSRAPEVGAGVSPAESVVRLFHEVAESVPAYREFLRQAAVDPAGVRALAEFRRHAAADGRSGLLPARRQAPLHARIVT
jgi:phenylacetate-CoA ligase